MAFDPHLPTRVAILEYFRTQGPTGEFIRDTASRFFDSPTYQTGRDLLRAYFQTHQPGNIESLRMAVSAFADKRLVRGIVQSILDDETTLKQIAGRSYPHPIGFDKFVLDDDRTTGFKFRLHVYWRGANFAQLERLHLHRFEMASAIVTGELTNHLWRVADYRPANDLLIGMKQNAAGNGSEQKLAFAYSGYRRDSEGNLRKTYLGQCQLVRGPSETFTSGDTYAQLLEDAHFVETNAETGFANGDFCSTIYVHGPSLNDDAGRALPVLFEESRLANDDQLISTIPAMTVENLRSSLIRYRDTLDEILRFYEWLYHPKHGRNLSAGMIAGYLLCEAFQTPHAIDVFEKRYDECKAFLHQHELAVRAHLQEGQPIPEDRSGRYIRLLAAKAKTHAEGVDHWIHECGNLVKEMWRYFGAIRGEAGPDITVLKPIWANVVRRKLPGGMHHGHIAAMIEAAYDANRLVMEAFTKPFSSSAKDEHHVTSSVDSVIEEHIRKILVGHFPSYSFFGEETGAERSVHELGDRRFLVDPIDGTRNFIDGREEFVVSIACQEWTGKDWHTTDAVLSHPPTGKIFWAELGQGAFLIERNDLESRLRIQTATANESRPLHGQTIDFSATGLGIEGQVSLFRRLLEERMRFRNSGSAGLILARISGRGGKAAIITANDYDVEAGRLIAQEAGATVSQLKFQQSHGSVTLTIAASSPAIHDGLNNFVRTTLEECSLPVLVGEPERT